VDHPAEASLSVSDGVQPENEAQDPMTKSDHLRPSDIWWAFRLIGDCRDLGHDQRLWHTRMLEGLAIMFGVVHAVGGEAWWHRPGPAVAPVSVHSVVAEPKAEEAFRAYLRARAPDGDPILGAIGNMADLLVTRTRTDLVPDTHWYRSATFNEHFRVGEIDHQIVSVHRVSDDGATSVIALNRALGDPDFSLRERRLLNFLHAELGRLIGGPLVSALEPNAAQLSPRLRQTLDCLLEGDSEKQVAARLDLSTATVHQYVTALYRHFHVQSRGQLMARVLQWLPRPQATRRNGTGRDLEP
jgi:DNA-binding CsgD family transcriptional regulator